MTEFVLRKDGYWYAPDKDPDEVLDYSLDWTQPLDGDTIATSVWMVPEGLNKGAETKTDTLTTVFLSGGTAGQTYTVANKITTAGGRTFERSFKLYLRER